MSRTVCLCAANTLGYPQGGGHLWVFLNWALGLRTVGCEVVWLETVPSVPDEKLRKNLRTLRSRLEQYHVTERLAVCTPEGGPVSWSAEEHCLDVDAVDSADLLLSLRYDLRPELLRRFRRTALVDIDPGMLQIWISMGEIQLAPYDVYFSIGETVGQPGARFPDGGLTWNYTPPAVCLPAWAPTPAASTGAYTTIAHWWGGEIDFQGMTLNNDKRTSFLRYLELPSHTSAPLELALCLAGGCRAEREFWEKEGWNIRDAWEVSSTPGLYHAYVQQSRGEFSCAKLSCTTLQGAWISDRTLCFLASGKPAVVEHTGPSRFLPDAEGLFRFRSPEEAARALDAVEADYEEQRRLARALAEEYFDAQKVVARVLERALA
jgi:hypothetical protein